MSARDRGGQGQGQDLEGGEHQVHPDPEDQPDANQDGRHEQRHLGAGTERDLQREIHLPLPRHHHRRGVLRRVADDRDHDEAEERLGEHPARGQRLDRPDQDSDSTAMPMVATARTTRARGTPQTGWTVGCGSPPSSRRWVRSEKSSESR